MAPTTRSSETDPETEEHNMSPFNLDNKIPPVQHSTSKFDDGMDLLMEAIAEHKILCQENKQRLEYMKMRYKSLSPTLAKYLKNNNINDNDDNNNDDDNGDDYDSYDIDYNNNDDDDKNDDDDDNNDDDNNDDDNDDVDNNNNSNYDDNNNDENNDNYNDNNDDVDDVHRTS